jgi:hypothetical protein
MAQPEELFKKTVVLVEKWLRRRIRREAVFRIVEGGLQACGGLIVVGCLAGGVAFIVFVGISWFQATHRIFRGGLLFSGCFLGVLFLSSLLRRVFHHGDGFGGPDFSQGDRELLAVASELITGGTALLAAGFESWATTSRLLGMDLSQVAPVILWLWIRNKKANSTEIAARFPDFNTVWTLPQLRDIPGIVWLPDPRGIILLTEDFRNDLGRVLPARTNFIHEEPPVDEEPASAWPNDRQPNREILAWYATLGLPPYAPIQQVKRRYRQLAKVYHPDASGAKGAQSQDKMVQINLAYENIMQTSAARGEDR